MDTIGARLRQERERLGLSQSAFGEIGGVQKRAQINYETDERRPDAAYLAAIAVHGVDVLYVLTGQRTVISEVQHSPLTARQASLLDNYDHTDEAGKKIIEATAFAAAQPQAASGGKR